MGKLTREELHRTFGGKIYGYDFEGCVSMTVMAKRIATDEKFDARCRKNLNATIGNDIYQAGN